MISRARKILFVSVIIISAAFFTFSHMSFALETDTHRAINIYIAQNSSNGFSINDYLKSQLGMQGGRDTVFTNGNLTQEVFKWIGDGSVYEDKPSWCMPYWRSRNHFHNPIDNSGFSGWWDTGIISGMSVVSWALQPVNTQSCGYYSWNDARSYYYKALTSTNKATRETNYADMFRAVGQVMHLVQDMSVPEHTRNDGHYFSYDYEEWAKTIAVAGYASSPKSYEPGASFPLTIQNLFDTDQYNGSYPGITIQNAIGLAEYTNANFLSPDTIFSGYAYPAQSDTLERREADPKTGRNILYLDKTGIGENYNYLARAKSLYNYLPNSLKKYALTLEDDNIYKTYASKLMPRAIGYSAQLLSYFFRGKLDIEMGQGSMKVRNASNETMTGGYLELYYDNSSDERNLLTSFQVTELATGADQTINFSPPQNAASYMLVYKGQLGSELNAVIGKFVPNGELVVITIGLVPNPYVSGEALAKSVSMVWNPVNNSLERSPVDNDNAGFQEWLAMKKVQANNLMYSDFVHDISEQHKLAPELIDDTNIDHHADASLSGLVFPTTIYSSVLLPGSPVVYAGIRTSKKKYQPEYGAYGGWYKWDYRISTVTVTGDNNPFVYNNYNLSRSEPILDDDPDFLPRHPGTLTQFSPPGTYYSVSLIQQYWHSLAGYDYTFYGIWGILGNFSERSVYEYTATSYPQIATETFIPGWQIGANYPGMPTDESYAKIRGWFDSNIAGSYTDRTIAIACVLKHASCKHITSKEDYYLPTLQSWLFDGRTIYVQAQALYALQGTTGYNWIAAGRNEALETQIIGALNMVYALNNIPANEIRKASLNISIVK